MQSCKTYAKSSLYGHLHAKLVTVCEYEQNASMSVGVAHTRYIQRDLQMDVRTYRGTYRWMYVHTEGPTDGRTYIRTEKCKS